MLLKIWLKIHKQVAKRFMDKKFNGWNSDQITQQLESGKTLEDVDVKLRFSILKPLHAVWVVDLIRLHDICRWKDRNRERMGCFRNS